MERLKEPLLPTAVEAHPSRAEAAVPALVLTCLVGYLVSGVSQPLLMSMVRFAGLADTGCQIYIVPYYLGMASVGTLTACDKGGFRRWRGLPLMRCLGIAIVGLVAQSLNWAGNMLAGSAIFAVVYASVTVWSALLSRCLLGKVLNKWQSFAVLTVFSGLALTGIGARSSGLRALLGACMVVVGAALHATSHVLSEFVSSRGRRIPPHVNCSMQGITNGCLALLWQCTYTSLHSDRIIEPARAAGTSFSLGATLLTALAVGNFVHSATFFFLLSRIGAISTGIMKGIQAVIVFVASHFMFCERDASQCFSPVKGLSLVVVISGALCYVFATSVVEKQKQRSNKLCD